MTNQCLTQEVKNARESWLHAIWSARAFSEKNLQTTTGKPIKIIFQGWKNTGAGADFVNAHLMIGDQELQGDIEIHLHSGLWNSHQHQKDIRYNSVILHVVLKTESSPPLKQDGTPLIELELHNRLQNNNKWLLENPELWLQNYDKLPGRCGIKTSQWQQQTLLACIHHAGELRMIHKANQITKNWDHKKPEEILYQLLLRACGQTKYALVFEQIAYLFPLSDIQQYLSCSFRESKTQILARWFGASHLLNESYLAPDASIRREQMLCLQIWEDLKHQPQTTIPFKVVSRPHNSPQRRLVGLFHHLYQWGEKGLLNGWINLFLKWVQMIDDQNLMKTIQNDCQKIFVTPEWEIWRNHFNTQQQDEKASQLIGKGQQHIIWNNAIIPFFLAYARQQKWNDLEQILYHIYINSKQEPANSITRFMEKRLVPTSNKILSSSRSKQGLLYLHRQYCQNFEAGCQQCKIIPFLDHFHQNWQRACHQKTTSFGMIFTD